MQRKSNTSLIYFEIKRAGGVAAMTERTMTIVGQQNLLQALR